MIPSYIVAGAISDTIRQLPASGELEERRGYLGPATRWTLGEEYRWTYKEYMCLRLEIHFFAKYTSELSTAAMQGSEQPRDGHFQS